MIERNKEFYKAVVVIIKHVRNGYSEIKDKEGWRLVGDYWPAVVELLIKSDAAIRRQDGTIDIDYPWILSPIFADCVNHIKDMEKLEKDRWLDNSGKWVAIVCGIGGFLLSLISIYLSFRAYTK